MMGCSLLTKQPPQAAAPSNLVARCEAAPDLKPKATMADLGKYTITVLGLLNACIIKQDNLAEWAEGR